MRKMSRFLAMLVSVALLVGMTPALALADDEYREPITLTVFSELANKAGEQAGWFAKEIKDRFNVTLNFVSTNLDTNAYSSGMAAGELGDIINFGATTGHFVDAINADMILNWDDLDLTPYENINKYMPTAMEKLSTYVEETTGEKGTWGFGYDVGVTNEGWANLTEPDYAMQIRYDVWVKAGKPELKTLADLPDFLQALQEAYPTNETGEKVYAYGGFSDWEDCVMKFTWDLMTWYGYTEWDFIGANFATGEVVNPLEEGSLYYEALKVNNELYRRGLFDPESVSQNFDTYSQKLNGGRYLMALWGWIIASNFNNAERSEQEIGFTTFMADDFKPIMNGIANLGGDRLWVLGADTEYPERCLEIIDWMCSEEGVIITNYGPKGLTWDYDENGVPAFTEFGWQAWENQKETVMPDEFGGGTFEDGVNAFNNATLKLEQIADGKDYSYSYKGWPTSIERSQNNLTRAWSENYADGAQTGVELYQNTGKYSFHPADGYVRTQLPDDLQSMRALFAPVMKQYSWKCVMSETEEEFAQNWQYMVTTCKEYGYDTVAEFLIADVAARMDHIAEFLAE